MNKVPHLVLLAVMGTSLAGCDRIIKLLKKDKAEHHDDDDDKKKADSTSDAAAVDESGRHYLGDTGFRPQKNGFKFENIGGKFPKTPPPVTSNVMVKLFGAQACVGGNTKSCKLTPPATEFSDMVNEAMNGGQCEGMAVSALTFFKNIDKAQSYDPNAKTNHDLTHAEVVPLIGYYWAYQVLNPVKMQRKIDLFTETPNSVEDRLVELWKKGDLATLAFFHANEGHAVTPYAVEDRGSNIHWIRIYDNNFPNTERYIIIDRQANTWKYDLASTNPSVPKVPWTGSADSHTISVVPLNLRLSKADCPFCKGAVASKMIAPRKASVTISDQEGRTVGMVNGEMVNDIPEAEVINISSYLDGQVVVQPIYVVPSANDYDVSLAAGEGPEVAAVGDEDTDSTGVRIFGEGSATKLDGLKFSKGEHDTVSLSHESEGVRYHTGTGRMPNFKMAMDDDKEGVSVHVRNLKADADSEVEMGFDRKEGKFNLEGGGKSTEGYDFKMHHVRADKDDEVVEEKGVKFKQGEQHSIDVKPNSTGTKRSLHIDRAPAAANHHLVKMRPMQPRKVREPKERDKDREKEHDKDKDREKDKEREKEHDKEHERPRVPTVPSTTNKRPTRPH